MRNSKADLYVNFRTKWLCAILVFFSCFLCSGNLTVSTLQIGSVQTEQVFAPNNSRFNQVNFSFPRPAYEKNADFHFKQQEKIALILYTQFIRLKLQLCAVTNLSFDHFKPHFLFRPVAPDPDALSSSSLAG